MLPTLDPELGALVATELPDHGVRVVTGATVTALTRSAAASPSTGPRPGVEVGGAAQRQIGRLGQQPVVGGRRSGRSSTSSSSAAPTPGWPPEAGATFGAGRAIAVDTAMRTSLPHVLAAGDCVQSRAGAATSRSP